MLGSARNAGIDSSFGGRQETGVWLESQRYPDSRIEILDESFAEIRLFNAAVERIATGMRWAEGPVWFGDGRYLLWSDIPNDRILRWDECDGSLSVFREPSNHANGNSRDRYGRLVTCEHSSRRVTRTEYDGSISVLADSFGGHRLNSPNDVAIKSDNSVWFTDPPFGLRGFYEGVKAQPELPCGVYRLDSDTLSLSLMSTAVRLPNGLCFSPDENRLYVVESWGQPERLIYVFDVTEGTQQLSNGRVFVRCGRGYPDGIRCDQLGNLWCGWGMGSEELDGVRVFSPQGLPLAHIHLEERCANLCFGGRHGNQVFMAAGRSMYRLFVNVSGGTFPMA